jgi:hypothetical protein
MNAPLYQNKLLFSFIIFIYSSFALGYPFVFPP